MPTRSDLPPEIPPPLVSFESEGGRRFTVGFGVRDERWSGDLLWKDIWPILHEGQPAGSLVRDLMYGCDMPRFRASPRSLYWRHAFDAPVGIGFDTGPYDAVEDALHAFGCKADEILDWEAGKAVRSIYAKDGYFRKGAEE